MKDQNNFWGNFYKLRVNSHLLGIVISFIITLIGPLSLVVWTLCRIHQKIHGAGKTHPFFGKSRISYIPMNFSHHHFIIHVREEWFLKTFHPFHRVSLTSRFPLVPSIEISECGSRSSARPGQSFASFEVFGKQSLVLRSCSIPFEISVKVSHSYWDFQHKQHLHDSGFATKL